MFWHKFRKLRSPIRSLFTINYKRWFNYCFCLEVCSLPTFANGQLLTTNHTQYFKSGSVVAVTCNSTYAPVSLTTICQSDRTWFPSPKCTQVTCSVPSLLNGYYVLNNGQVAANSRLSVESVITPSCVIGYTPTPSTARTCQSDSQWTEQQPTCIAITCESLPHNVVDGHYDAGGSSAPYQYNYRVTPLCNAGYYLQRGEERQCTEINVWSGEDAVCLPITCTPPNNYSHGSYNGTQTVYTFGSTLIPSCQTGYRLNNNHNVRICVNNNTWSGSKPECHIVQFTAPPTIEHGSLSSGMDVLDYEAVITVTCNHGYEEEYGRTNLTCRDDGTWGSSLPRCVPIPCNDSSDVTHTAITDYPSLAFGEVGNVFYNTTFYNLQNGTLEVNCSSERKLNWMTQPIFGK